MKTNHKKIDIVIRGEGYLCSTTWSKTCKEAKAKFLDKHPEYEEDQVITYFDKGGK